MENASFSDFLAAVTATGEDAEGSRDTRHTSSVSSEEWGQVEAKIAAEER